MTDSYQIADALYRAGWDDRHKERNYDPRKTDEWRVAVDALARSPAAPEGKFLPLPDAMPARRFQGHMLVLTINQVHAAILADRAARAPVAADRAELVRGAKSWARLFAEALKNSTDARHVEAMRAGMDEAIDRLATPSGEPKPEPVAAQLARALKELRDLCANNPTMQGREYVGIGIAANNALAAFERAAEPVSPTSAGEVATIDSALTALAVAVGVDARAAALSDLMDAAAAELERTVGAPVVTDDSKELRRMRAALARPAAPAQPVAGLSVEQEPKYTVNGSAIVNRASGEPIPADEPVFIFRARDKWAAGMLGDPEHAAAVNERFIQFGEWAEAHPERMKEPDTAPQPTPAPAEATPMVTRDSAVTALHHLSRHNGPGRFNEAIALLNPPRCDTTPAPGAPMSRDAGDAA